MHKKFFAGVLACVLVFILNLNAFAVEYGAAGYEDQGYSEATAWEISSAETLVKVRDDYNNGKIQSARYFKLTADIDLTSYLVWDSICDYETTLYSTFDGIFDGNGYTVSMNSVNDDSKHALGLFGFVNGGTIKNLSVKGTLRRSDVSNLYGDAYAGGIACSLEKGTITNCNFDGSIYIKGAIYKSAYAGGIVGYAGSDGKVIITNCSVGKKQVTEIEAEKDNFGYDAYAGGIVGYYNDQNTSNQLTGNYARVTVEADTGTGKIYGYRHGSSGTISGNTEADSTWPAITTDSLTDGIKNNDYSCSIEANVESGTITYSASGLPEGLEISSTTGEISGTPTETGNNITVTVTATANSHSDTKNFSLTIYDDLEIETETISDGVVNEEYSETLEASITTGVTWKLQSGTLPKGLELDESTGMISGKPTSKDEYTFTIKASATIGTTTVTDQKEYTVNIANPEISITTDKTLPDGIVSSSYSETLECNISNGVTWSCEDLPEWLTLNKKTGKLSGKPTEAGEYTFTVKATDGDTEDEKTFTLNIEEEINITITTSSLPGGTTDEEYNATLKANVSGVTWSATNLPTWLNLNSSTGVLSGKPTTATDYNFSVTAKLGTKTSPAKTFTITVKQKKSDPAAITISPTSLSSGTVGSSYSAGLTASESGVTWSATNLPSWLKIDSETGVLSGTPPAADSYKFTINVTKGNAAGSREYTINITESNGLTITTPALSSGTVGTNYNVTLKANFGGQEISSGANWRVSNGTLPSGISLSSSSGILSGTPKSTGTTNIEITVSYNNLEAIAAYTLTINSEGSVTISTSTIPDAVKNERYQTSLTADGEVSSWSILEGSSLPSGLNINRSSGVISGTPTVSGSYQFTIKATGNSGSDQKTFDLYIEESGGGSGGGGGGGCNSGIGFLSLVLSVIIIFARRSINK